MTTALWQPGDESQNSQLANFWQQARDNSGQPLPDYQSLHRWSVEQPAAFWQQVWDQCGVIGNPGDTVLTTGKTFQSARWFANGELNYAENLLKRNDSHTAVILSLIHISEPTRPY